MARRQFRERFRGRNLATVVQTLDSGIHWVNHYPLDNSIGFAGVYPLDLVDSAIHRLNNWGLIW